MTPAEYRTETVDTELQREIEKLRGDALRLVDHIPNVLVRELVRAVVCRLIYVLVSLERHCPPK